MQTSVYNTNKNTSKSFIELVIQYKYERLGVTLAAAN